MKQAFAFLAEAETLAPGRYELANGLFALVSEGETVPMDSIGLEAHRKYIDLQYCASGSERMGWAHLSALTPVSSDPERDYDLYAGPATMMTIEPGMFYIMFPADGHKATCHQETPRRYRKIVVKIPIAA